VVSDLKAVVRSNMALGQARRDFQGSVDMIHGTFETLGKSRVPTACSNTCVIYHFGERQQARDYQLILLENV
jgi:hypothetical protein